MGGRNCCVPSCRRKSHDHRRRKIPNGLTFHCFPAWRRNEGEQISELTMRRRAAWVAAVGRGDITFNHIPTSMRVCSRHFHSGKPAYEMLESDPDWIPSLHLGPRDGTSRRTEHLSEQRDRDQKRRLTPETGPSPLSTTAQREPEGGIPAYEMLESSSDWVPSLQLGSSEGTSRPAECLLLSEQRDRDQKQRLTPETGPSPVCRTAQREPEGGPVGTAVRPWREVKSLLQSVLLPRDETGEQPPAAKKMDLSFRDFFRDALEASLEACSRSRSPSARQTSVSGDYEVELNFKLPPVKEENQTCDVSSSSGCLNCVSLQRTIVELQEKLSRLTGEQQEVEALLQPDQVLQSPETGHTEETETAYFLECDQAESPAFVPDERGSEDSLECDQVESPAAVVTDEFENEGEGVEEDYSSVGGSPRRSRKKGDAETWDENIQKARGMMKNQEPGLNQMGMRCQSAACQKSIKLCCNDIEDSKREEIFKYFWGKLDWKERKTFVKSLVQVSSVKRRRTGAEESRRSASNSCHLVVDGRKIRVCQSMFLSTLGINQWCFLKWVGRRGKNPERACERATVRSEQHDFLKTFLLDLPKVSSHPCMSSSSKMYLEPVFKSIRRLHTDYKRCCAQHGIQSLSRQVFTNIFNDLNLSLFRQKKGDVLLET
ncbi:uncharacterized protein LOC119894039 isoform X2 [Micropterus salmoides]|uniref:uncharacterized protein LOC119894039 isoform X2 n=1 Tax=Micropterus salmoides TaxID=27706 RepID=UPI0018EA4E14|nr:uncharacterized protein LOC119894039 isoform X2 [Micropterus salmoides]